MAGNKFIYKILIIILVFLFTSINFFPQDNTSDEDTSSIRNVTTDDEDSTADSEEKRKEERRKKFLDILDDDYDPEEELKKLPVVFDLGGAVLFKSRILFKTFEPDIDGGFHPLPDDEWYGEVDGKIWGRMAFEEGRYIHLGAEVLFKVQKEQTGFKRNTIVPVFNIDEFYLNWEYVIGKVVIGRTNYNLKAAMVFNGPLDGLELNINIPYLNFKTFLGFTGALGIFNPHFNPYSITSTDRAFVEESNLINSQMIVKFNAEQSRRIFFATDFDIHFFGQHINPYFLMQYDLTSMFYNMDPDHDVNTFHLGLNLEGRIVKNLYYQVHLSGLFGTHPSSVTRQVKPIVSCALETKLRVTIPKGLNSTFLIGYALGTGNSESTGDWSEYASDSNKGFWSDKYDGTYNNKFYYFGKFDGGYVLNPILSNIHSISFKYSLSPFNNGRTHITIYIAAYQTFKLNPTGPISDEECTSETNSIESYIVGSEINAGMMINAGSHFNFGFDCGLYIPELAYQDKSLRFKIGATMAVVF